MIQHPPAKPPIRFIAAILAFSIIPPAPLLANNGTHEHAQLAAILRHLDMVDRLVDYSADLPRSDNTRYTFDYRRLERDIERVRVGIHGYLSPEREQPRDLLELSGDYRHESFEAAP